MVIVSFVIVISDDGDGEIDQEFLQARSSQKQYDEGSTILHRIGMILRRQQYHPDGFRNYPQSASRSDGTRDGHGLVPEVPGRECLHLTCIDEYRSVE